MSQPEPEESPQQEAIVEETQPQPAEPEPNVPVEVEEPPAAVAETPKLAPESEAVRRPTLNDDSRDPTVNDESMEQDLKKNKAVKIELPPPMSNRQLLMLAVFIILEAFHS